MKTRASPRRETISRRVVSAVAVSATPEPRMARRQRELDVLRPEIVPPLRTSEPVDGEEPRAARARQAQEAGTVTLRRDIEQVEPPASSSRSTSRRASAAASIEQAALTPASRSCHLVVHQRDQGNDDAAALAHQRRDLEAQRFAAAGGHQYQRIAAARDVLDDLPCCR
jgi:hypothetical protein